MGKHPLPKKALLTDDSPQCEYELALFLEWFGERLRWERDWAGLTQIELARRLEIPQCQLSRLENGSVDFSISTLLKIVAVFHHELPAWIPSNDRLHNTAYRMGSWGVRRRGRGILKNRRTV